LRREYTEKDKILGGMKEEIDEKQRQIDGLKLELEKRQREFEELQGVLREALGEGQDLDGMIDQRDRLIKELEDELKGGEGRLKESNASRFVPASGDDLDAMIHDYLRSINCDIPIKKIGGGYYIFGTKKIYAKIMNNKLVIRIGGGYCLIDEFVANYADSERTKIQMIKEQGGDPFAVDEKGSPVRFN
jgi:predicted nuclease with TOPRIM domain